MFWTNNNINEQNISSQVRASFQEKEKKLLHNDGDIRSSQKEYCQNNIGIEVPEI